MSEHIKQVSNEDFESTVLQSSTPVLVDFWADWCGPCRMLAPILDRIAEKNAKKLTVVEVNVDTNQDIAQKYNIRGIPTIILFKSGNVVATHVGMATESKLSSFIDENL